MEVQIIATAWMLFAHYFFLGLFLLTVTMIFVGDKLVGEVSRLVVAEACIQALDIEFTQGQIYEINSVKVGISFDQSTNAVIFFREVN